MKSNLFIVCKSLTRTYFKYHDADGPEPELSCQRRMKFKRPNDLMKRYAESRWATSSSISPGHWDEKGIDWRSLKDRPTFIGKKSNTTFTFVARNDEKNFRFRSSIRSSTSEENNLIEIAIWRGIVHQRCHTQLESFENSCRSTKTILLFTLRRSLPSDQRA